jgi:hypothetical protein
MANPVQKHIVANVQVFTSVRNKRCFIIQKQEDPRAWQHAGPV